MPLNTDFDNVDLLYKIFKGIRGPLKEAHARTVNDIIDLYYDTASIVRGKFPTGVHVGAVRTGFFRNTIKERTLREASDFFTSEIASDAPYSDVIERGWIHRARGQASYPGRYPAQIAAESAVLVIGPNFDQALGSYFGRF